MPDSSAVARALARLLADDLLGEVVDVRATEPAGAQTVVVSLSVEAPTDARAAIDRVLMDVPHDVVAVERRHGIVRDGAGFKDGQVWRLGSDEDVAWIAENTQAGLAITSAIPPIFESYATLGVPEDDAQREASESALLRLLVAQSGDQPWWLGYLDTGAHDLVFGRAPKVTLYAGWHYVLVEAGPLQAATWREDDPWRGRLPDLIFPADRAWLVSMLWDDDWRCIGGDAALLSAVLAAPELDSRSVTVEEDSTPPGHVAR